MKSLTAALFFGLFFSSLCFAQTQTGNASYNAAKSGVTIAHPSMSFGTRVRVTNLRNNREVIATVDGRIPASDPRIADISPEAGDAIGMSPSGYTEVRLEQLVHQVPAAAAPPGPPETAAVVQTPPPTVTTAPPPSSAPVSKPPASQAPEVQETRVVESIQVINPPQQYTAPMVVNQSCFSSPLCIVILILLIIVTLLLGAIFFLLLNNTRRLPWWSWYYPVWVRRHIRYLKNRRY